MSQSQSVDNDAGFANLVEPIGNLRFRSLFRHNFHRAAFRIHIAHTQCRFGYLRRTFQIPLLTLRSECPLDAHTALTHAQHAEHVRFAITERELILIL